MFKKMAIGGGLVMLLLALVFGRDVFSYVSTSAGWVQNRVKESVPVEFELDRARKMISQLEPEIRDATYMIAKQEVKVDNLRGQRDKLKEQLAANLGDIDRLRKDLEREDSTYVYAGKSYSSSQVKSDLTRRWDLYKVRQATMDKMDDILEARMTGLKAAHSKLAEMKAAKRQLEVDVENLEARLELVKVAQTASDINLDDSHLARTKELVAEIGTRIDVASKLASAEDTYTGQIQLDEPETRNILDEIAQELDRVDGADYIVLDK